LRTNVGSSAPLDDAQAEPLPAQPVAVALRTLTVGRCWWPATRKRILPVPVEQALSELIWVGRFRLETEVLVELLGQIGTELADRDPRSEPIDQPEEAVVLV